MVQVTTHSSPLHSLFMVEIKHGLHHFPKILPAQIFIYKLLKEGYIHIHKKNPHFNKDKNRVLNQTLKKVNISSQRGMGKNRTYFLLEDISNLIYQTEQFICKPKTSA